ncbi:MAG: hypothetical protein ACPG5O_04090 [Pseudoalteromonas tetraodonis]
MENSNNTPYTLDIIASGKVAEQLKKLVKKQAHAPQTPHPTKTGTDKQGFK